MSETHARVSNFSDNIISAAKKYVKGFKGFYPSILVFLLFDVKILLNISFLCCKEYFYVL